jgi:HSP20 family protein
MAVLRWDPWGELAALQRDVNELFGRTVGAAGATQRRAATVPPIDAYRTQDELVVQVELPGATPGDVEVAVNEGVLTVSGERKLAQEVADDRWVRRERALGAFERSFTLPEGTDPGKITASFENGVLELHVPHPPERKPRRIEVSTSGASGQTVDVQPS